MQRMRSSRFNEWLRRYIPAEIIGTALALAAAWVTYAHSHSFAGAAGAGWVGEGIGFYGYFVAVELRGNAQRYRQHAPFKRLRLALAAASTNLVVEFLPAELLDNFLIRPFAMYAVPRFIHPYPLGFLAGKFSADLIFYLLAIIGYETRKRWLHPG